MTDQASKTLKEIIEKLISQRDGMKKFMIPATFGTTYSQGRYDMLCNIIGYMEDQVST